jgi:hypothetical protein
MMTVRIDPIHFRQRAHHHAADQDQRGRGRGGGDGLHQRREE